MNANRTNVTASSPGRASAPQAPQNIPFNILLQRFEPSRARSLKSMLHRPHVYQCFKRLSTKRSYNASSTISELDHVLLKHADPRRGTTFTKPLLRGRTLQTQYGRIAHDNIIGLRERDLVETHKSTKLRVHLPSLEEYVTLSPRRVTPVC
jgi:hypothetical protein